jgi:DNA-binding NarL/FixJ family response regulator
VPKATGHLRVLVQSNRRVISESVAAGIEAVGLAVIADSTDPRQGEKSSAQPDVVIVVGSQIDASTSAAVRTARRRWHRSLVIALAETDRVEDGIALVRQGADTWLSRSDGLSVLRSLLARVATGERLLLPAGALEHIAASLQDRVESPAEATSRLTNRERQVLECFARGQSRPDIAAMLGISPATLRTHVQNILRKVDVHSIRQAIEVALLEGLTLAGDEA